MKKVIVYLIALGLLAHLSAYAISPDEIMSYNQSVSSSWVNWYPTDWHRDVQIEQLASQLVSNTSTRQDIPRALHDWICENIYYDQEALEQDIYSALSASDVLRERRGVCEGIANLTQALFIDAGIPCIKVWGVAIADGEQWENTYLDLTRVNHTWNEYYMDGHWITIDCTMDMGNRYFGGAYFDKPYQHNYLAPDNIFLANTHLKLRRGFDLPENIPSDWAKNEIETAVQRELVPLPFLTNYTSSITEKEFYELLGLSGGQNEPITRMDAATLLGTFLNSTNLENLPYQDVSGYSVDQLTALSALYQREIMCGYASSFFPARQLSKQEAIVLVVRMSEKED